MSRNIKEIGKELMGKSLNSFHRKTGLTQLEENNKMQDGILDGILSQVDDVYIEKTEQSNVIHLDGSGDGVVVVDSVEGNTLVNCLVHGVNYSNWYTNYCGYKDNLGIYLRRGTKYLVQGGSASSTDLKLTKEFISTLKDNTTYTFIFNVDIIESVSKEFWVSFNGGYTTSEFSVTSGINKVLITTNNPTYFQMYSISDKQDVNADVSIRISNMIMIEGDWVNKETPNYFEGLQSSFEEKVNSDNKHEIEILSSNKNLWNGKLYSGWGGETPIMQELGSRDNIITDFIRVKKNTTYYINIPSCTYSWLYDKDKKLIKSNLGTINAYINGTNSEDAYYMIIGRSVGNAGIDKNELKNVMISKVKNEKYVPQKQNKIKLLINEPLRSTGNAKDTLCVKDGKLVVKRICKSKTYDGSDDWSIFDIGDTRQFYRYIYDKDKSVSKQNEITSINDKYPSTYFANRGNSSAIGCALMTYSTSNNSNLLCIYKSKSESFGVASLKQELNNNPMTIIYELAEPYYEEVLNEYGEPIILEGYENGTIYIDSTIVPTTTVRYTPKMESFKTLKEVNNNNIMLTNDVNDNIIPYMMDVDLMIMEKEMALMSHKNIRTIGVKDMTSMQKRTQDMLTRLIKGKTLTEQECKTRVVTYLDAGKITDAQAEELMLLISEVYNI